MFRAIFLFELKYRFRRPATYIYFAIILIIGLLYGGIMGGAFGAQGAGMLTGGGRNLANSPYNLHQIISGLAQLPGIFIIAALMGVPVLRDFEHKTHEFFFTSPISKFGYLGGRFFGSLTVTLLVLTGIIFGLIISQWLPKVDATKYGDFHLIYYLNPFFTSVLPLTLFTGTIFFTTVSLSRNQLFIYLNAIAILVLLSVASVLATELENKTIAALIDPTGSTAFINFTEYWTVTERNSQIIPLRANILINLLIWIGFTVALWWFTFKKFTFSYGGSFRFFAQKAGSTLKLIADTVTLKSVKLPIVKQDFSQKVQFNILTKLLKRETMGMIKNPIFLSIVGIGIIWMVVVILLSGQIFETPTYPVTYRILDQLSAQFNLFILAITVFYTGELVWVERDKKVSPMIDALPLPNWVIFSSKLLSIFIIQAMLLFLVMFVGILVQTFNGYFNYELGLYLKTLFGFRIIDLLLYAVLAFFIQVLVNNKYLGFFLVVLLIFLPGIMFNIGLEHKLMAYGSDTGLVYSDMNGYGHFPFGFLMFKLYWGGLAILLALMSRIFWVRGPETDFKSRRKVALQNFNLNVKIISIVGLFIFIGAGMFIYYNTNILNNYITSDNQVDLQVNYEKKYQKYHGIAQPKIIDVYLEVDLFPENRDFKSRGKYVLKNKTQQSFDSIHILLNSDLIINDLSFSSPSKLVFNDEEIDYRIYQLNKPLLPGDSTMLSFDLEFITEGFPHSRWNNQIAYNGTFFNSQYFPQIGYNPNYEITSETLRKKHNLPEKSRVPSIDDTLAIQRNFISHDADWINFEAIISTSQDQIAIVPGYLQKEWSEGDRRYFHYKMDTKMLNFYSVLSARYEVIQDQWISPENDSVNLEIYYHLGHEYNLDNMMNAMKKSLDYYSANFGPYQHKQVRILEFPRYASFAQSFANTIPYSESIGFIADVDEDEDDINYPFYVTAHEVAHQWWAHQVIGGNVQGSQFLSETMSQYSAMMVMEKELGEDQIKKYLKLETNNYLRGRAGERREEMPAMLSENQQYIHYNKGSVIMYALKDYIGEDSLNFAIRRYLNKVKFQEAPYTTTKEFLSFIRDVTPDTLQYIITDLFETITLYENKLEVADFERFDSLYKVTIKLDVKKYRVDSTGNEIEISLNDYMDIGIYGRKEGGGRFEEETLYLKKHLITSPDQELIIWVDKEPRNAGIDPLNKLIDKKPDDNTMRVTEKDN